MNPLLDRLAVVRRRYRLVTFASGVFAVSAVVIGVLTLVGLFDYTQHLPRLMRASVLVGLLAGSGFLIHRLLIDPLTRRSDNLSLALRIEDQHPELNDALASTIQFLENPDSPLAGDPAIRERAIQKATAQAASFDFHAILDYRFLGLSAAALFVAVAAAGYCRYHEPDLSRTALLRLADPFGQHPWTRIDVPNAATRIAVGHPFRLKASLAGVIPANVKVEMQAQNPFNGKFETRPEIVLPTKLELGRRTATVATPLDVSQKPLTFRYRITGNDGSFPPSRNQWHTVEVLQPPSFIELDGLPSPQIELHVPAYTQLPSPVKLSPGTRHLDMIQGTEVVFRARVDRPVRSATIELKPVDAAVRLSSLVGLVGSPALLPQLGPTAFHQSFSWFQTVRLDESRTQLSARFRPWIAGSYAVHLIDDNGLSRTYEADLRVSVDPVPVVQLKRPAVSQSFLETAEIPVQLFAEDDVFAVRSAFLEYRRKNAQGDWIDAKPKRIMMYDPSRPVEKGMPDVTMTVVPPAPARAKRLELSMLWSLKKQFKVGDILMIQGAADDYCDVFTPRLAGRSHEIEIRIVASDDLARQLDENLAQVQQELLALKKIEDEAQDLLDEIPKDKKDEARDPKADARALDQAIEAAQKVKQVQERIGARAGEGLRDKLEQMKRTIKDNKLPDSDIQDQIRTIDQELERLVQEEFPKLEQDLIDLRKELSGVSKSKVEDKKSPLEKSKETNAEIQKTLGELTKSLDRWADLAQLKGQTRDLMDKQKALAEKVEKLTQEKELADTKQAKDALKEEASKLASEQKKLDQEAKELINRIKQSKARQDGIANIESEKADEGDKDAKQRAEDAKDTSKKLRNAQGAANEGGLNKEMAGAADELKQNNPNAAKQKQEQAAKTLDKMVKALEGQKDDDIDRLRKKQKDANVAQNDLDKLQKKVDQLQKNQKAGKADPKEQAQDLRDAAEDLRDQARRLMRLQEPKAARELQKAAQKLDEAAKKAEAGENAEDLEMEAQEHIEQARQQLEHLQEELAREQLARIADRLKGLKERQDTAIEQSTDLQAKIEARGKWSRGLLESLEGHRQSQTGLAKESRSLEEKLKGALVFEHILKKAGKAMEQAAETMGERKAVGVDRQNLPLEDEEKADEKKRHSATLKLQKLAADRLDRLLEALKDPPPMAKQEPKDQPKNKDQPEGKDEPQGGRRGGGDGIPPMAQLKALKSEQVEVYERTKEFAEQNPDPARLTEVQERELRELTDEQGRLRQIFEQMTNRKEGDMP